MEAIIKVREEKIFQFQKLVKSFNMRFVGKPYIYGGFATVVVNGDHIPMKQCNEFFETWNRMNTPIVEVPQKTKFQRFIKKVKNFFS